MVSNGVYSGAAYSGAASMDPSSFNPTFRLNLISELPAPPNDKYHHLLSEYGAEEILNWSNRELCDDLRPENKRVLEERRPKAVVLDSNAFQVLPKEFFSNNLRFLSVCGQFAPKRSSSSKTTGLAMFPESISIATNLVKLYAASNRLKSVPECFRKFTNLKVVDLRQNELRRFPAPLLDVTSLEEILLSGNYISEIPLEIKVLRQLQIFRIGGNDLTSLPESLSSLKKLHTLSIKNNKIEKLPQRLFECKKLEEGSLDISDNPISYPPKETWGDGVSTTLATLEYLRQNAPDVDTRFEEEMSSVLHVLDLKDKNLTQVEAPDNTRDVHTLDASKNDIADLDGFPEVLKGIKTLNLSENRFVKFPLNMLKDLKNLLHLNLDHQRGDRGSPLEQPQRIYRLQSLRELYLCHNSLAHIPQDFYMLVKLEVLMLDSNEIEEIPEEIEKLQELKVLRLCGNKIKILPDVIGKLINLRVLGLSRNQLRSLPASICALKNLHTLSLRTNHLKQLPVQLSKLSKLLSEETFVTAMNAKFQSGLFLEDNYNPENNTPSIEIPQEDVIRSSTKEIFDELTFYQEHPHVLEQQIQRLSKSHIRGGVQGMDLY